MVKIKDTSIGATEPVYVIAEMAWSHDGSLDNAKAICKGAADAGADAISIHVTSVKDYMVRAYGSKAGKGVSEGKEQEVIFNYLDRVNLKGDDWNNLFAYAREIGLAVCVMPNDLPSLKLCSELKPDAYVIAASCFVEENMVQGIAEQKMPVILRVGGATLGEIERTISILKSNDVTDIIILYGFQSYPTKIEDSRLKLIPVLQKTFGLPVGLADHIDADSHLAMALPLVAMGMGATVIEKHVTHNRALKGEDFESALNPDELKQLVSDIREIEKSFGPDSFQPLSPEEVRYRQVSRKRTVAVRDIQKGSVLSSDDIVFKRADDGIYPDEIEYVIGRTADTDINEDDPITWEKLI